MTEFTAPWVESFEQVMAAAYNAAERIRLELGEDGFAQWAASPEVRAMWDHANSGVGSVSVTFGRREALVADQLREVETSWPKRRARFLAQVADAEALSK